MKKLYENPTLEVVEVESEQILLSLSSAEEKEKVMFESSGRREGWQNGGLWNNK